MDRICESIGLLKDLGEGNKPPFGLTNVVMRGRTRGCFTTSKPVRVMMSYDGRVRSSCPVAVCEMAVCEMVVCEP